MSYYDPLRRLAAARKALNLATRLGLIRGWADWGLDFVVDAPADPADRATLTADAVAFWLARKIRNLDRTSVRDSEYLDHLLDAMEELAEQVRWWDSEP